MMVNWREFFQTYRIIEIKDDEDLLYQVGTTVRGNPISQEQFSLLVDEIKLKLDLSDNDNLLDLCCGNGVITYELSKLVNNVTGIDGSKAYIENAIKWKSSANLTYILCDVLDFKKIIILTKNLEYSKVLIYGSLAYFDKPELTRILKFLYDRTTKHSLIFIGSILDRSRLTIYFNTLGQRLNYLIDYLIKKNDPGLGRWWSKRELGQISDKCGFGISYFSQSPQLHTAHYRFDIVLKKY